MAGKEGFLEKTKLNIVDSSHETRNLALKWGTLGLAGVYLGVGWAWVVAKYAAVSAAFDQAVIMGLDREGNVAKQRKESGKSYWTGFDWGSINPLRSGRERVNKPTFRTALVGI